MKHKQLIEQSLNLESKLNNTQMSDFKKSLNEELIQLEKLYQSMDECLKSSKLSSEEESQLRERKKLVDIRIYNTHRLIFATQKWINDDLSFK